LKQKQITLPAEFFITAVKLHTALNDVEPDVGVVYAHHARLGQLIDDKISAMNRREAYSASKSAESPEEREAARKKYLDMVGIPESFRW
jgi:hypothetical protein